jgi:hypothetical protein
MNAAAASQHMPGGRLPASSLQLQLPPQLPLLVLLLPSPPPQALLHLSRLDIRSTYVLLSLHHAPADGPGGTGSATGGGPGGGSGAGAGSTSAAATATAPLDALVHPLMARLHPLTALPVHFGGVTVSDVVTDTGGRRLVSHSLLSAVAGALTSTVLHPVAALRGAWYGARVLLAAASHAVAQPTIAAMQPAPPPSRQGAEPVASSAAAALPQSSNGSRANSSRGLGAAPGGDADGGSAWEDAW